MTPRPRRTVAVGAGSATASVPRAGDGGRRHVPERGSRGAIALAAGAAVIVAIVVLAVSGVFGGGSSKPAANRVAPIHAAGGKSAGTAAPSRGSTVVTVLNGTTVTGLAQQTADKLRASGYPIDRTTDAADQAQQTSEVAYAAGYRPRALDIARMLGIPTADVAPIDPSTRAVAGNAAGVVVTMGSDKAQ